MSLISAMNLFKLEKRKGRKTLFTQSHAIILLNRSLNYAIKLYLPGKCTKGIEQQIAENL